MTETGLATIPPLMQALALATETKDTSALRDIHAMATALQKGAQARSLGIEAENEAAEVILRTERALGALLVRMAESGERSKGAVKQLAGRAPGGKLLPLVEKSDVVTLRDLGIDRNQSSLWQRVAQMPDWLFEERLADARKNRERIAKYNFYAKHPLPHDPVREQAMADLREALAEDDDPAVFVAFEGGTRGIIEEMPRLPLDILPRVATLIRELANAYNVERMRRA